MRQRVDDNVWRRRPAVQSQQVQPRIDGGNGGEILIHGEQRLAGCDRVAGDKAIDRTAQADALPAASRIEPGGMRCRAMRVGQVEPPELLEQGAQTDEVARTARALQHFLPHHRRYPKKLALVDCIAQPPVYRRTGAAQVFDPGGSVWNHRRFGGARRRLPVVA